MADLYYLKRQLSNARKNLAAKQAEKQNYLNTAADIKKVYNRMADDKRTLKEYRNSAKTSLSEKYDTFKGSLYTDTYKAKLNALINDYDSVIKNIDTNMDRLNTARAQYENKAYKCNGPIGYLQSTINSLVHTIENWVN